MTIGYECPVNYEPDTAQDHRESGFMWPFADQY